MSFDHAAGLLATLGVAACAASCGAREDPRALLAEGKRLMDAKEYAASIAPLDRAFALEPGLVPAGISLAEVLIQEERHEKALEALRRLEPALEAAAAKGGGAEAVRQRAKAAFLAGRAAKELGRLGEAEAALRRSLAVLPSNAATHALLGNVLALQGRHGEAAPHLEESLRAMEALKVEAGKEQLHYQLATCLAALGRTAEADAHFRAHQDLKSRSDRAYRREREEAYARLASEAASGPAAGRDGAADREAAGRPPLATPAAQPVEGTRTRAPGPSSGPTFVECARESGIDFRHSSGARGRLLAFETVGGGAAWIDHDQDGDPDLYLVACQPPGDDGSFAAEGRNRLYRNDGGRFADVTAPAGVAGRGCALGAAVGDIDDDGFPDLYVLCFGPNLLYRNRGDGTFEEVRGSGAEGSDPFSGGAAFADFDSDGRLDLFVTTYLRFDLQRPPRCYERSRSGERIEIYCGPVSFEGGPDKLYRNLGGGRFEDASARSGIGTGADARSESLGVLAADLDEDGDVDVFVACDTTPNLLYVNRSDGTFEERGLAAGVAVSDAGLYEGSMGIALGDSDGDLHADLLVTNFAEEPNRLYLGLGNGLFLDGTARTGIAAGSRPLVGWGTAFFDAGCDGRLDLFVANGHIYHNAEEWLPGRTYRQRSLLYVREGERWRERGAEAGKAFERQESCRGAALADHDLDGDVDILVVAVDAAPLLLRAEGPRGRFLEVDLAGSGPGGRDAVGARVEIETRSGRQVRWRAGGGSYLSASDGRLHFGLGPDERVERLTVTWPGGGRTELRDVPADRRIVVRKDAR
ncbi:MAG: VCBS repeat-containing protein [Planctomycetes bacterium]|nr:VCBS repeat-containing protein [Planctomycetota bacterium]